MVGGGMMVGGRGLGVAVPSPRGYGALLAGAPDNHGHGPGHIHVHGRMDGRTN